MRKYRVSRFKQFIFPQELIIDKYHVLTRKRHFPSFWLVTEESIPLSKLASIQIHRGFVFSKLIIENSGGPYPIVVEGLWNGAAREARDILERIEREMQAGSEVEELVDDDGFDEAAPPPQRDPHNADTARPPRDARKAEQPRQTDSRLSQTAFDIAMNRITDSISKVSRGRTAKVESTQKPPKAEYDPFPLLKPTAESAERRSTPPETRRSAPSRSDQLTTPLPKRFGNLPSDDWQPRPPWEPTPVEEENHEEETGFATIDPVEFLSQDAVFQTTAKEGSGERPDYLGTLVSWWDRAKTSITSGVSRQSRRSRKLR